MMIKQYIDLAAQSIMDEHNNTGAKLSDLVDSCKMDNDGTRKLVNRIKHLIRSEKRCEVKK